MDDGTPMTSGADDDGSAAADDGVGGDDNPTTCVHTADGFIRCGDVVGKRDDGDVGSGGLLFFACLLAVFSLELFGCKVR